MVNRFFDWFENWGPVTIILAVLFVAAVSIGGCSSPAPLPPIAPPTPPVVVKVPVLVTIPPTMTQPCPEPPKRAITTDVELLEAADAFRFVMRCNAAKLRAIAAGQQP